MSALALIAGQGRLPALLAGHLQAAGRAFTVFAPDGFAPDGLSARTFRFEHLGSLIAGLRGDGFAQVCLAGAVRRPRLDPAALDAATRPLLPRILSAMGQGDDALLRMVVGLFEDAGLQVLGAHQVMPGLVAAPGALTDPPAPGLIQDASRGDAILAALAPLDLAQAVVVSDGHCLGIEALPGTAALLDFVARTRLPGAPGPGGVLVKRSKPAQDPRIDLPSVGPDTVAQARAAGLAGICVEAGRVLLIDRAAMVAAAAGAGICLWAAP